MAGDRISRHLSSPAASNHYGVEALSLEGPGIRVVCVPSLGAKLVSIVNLDSGREWLVQPRVLLGRVPYAGAFTEGDMSGWDEMFPTINPCPYPLPGGRAGSKLPDHGEVWSLPWSVAESTGTSLTLSIEGRALPYRLTRRLMLAGRAALRMRYRLENLSDEPLTWLWAAHPQFACPPGTAVILADEVVDLLQVCEPDSGWVPAGAPVTWPWATTPGGSRVRIDRIAAGVGRGFYKLYVRPEQQLNWAAMSDETTGDRLRLSWDPGQIPYLGIWVDQACFNDVPTIALEPSTGFYDDLAHAHGNGRAVTTAPRQAVQWQLAVTLAAGDTG